MARRSRELPKVNAALARVAVVAVAAGLTAAPMSKPVSSSRPSGSVKATAVGAMATGNTLTPATADDGRPPTYPSMQQWAGAPGDWVLSGQSRILVSGPDQSVAADVARLFQQDLALESGRHLAVLTTPAGQHVAPNPHDIALSLDAGDPALGDEGYRLDAGDVLAVHANARSGLLYGAQSILQIIKSDPQRSHVPHGTARDWPALSQRGQMIDVGRKYYPLPYLRAQIREMAWMKLNMLHLHLTDWNGFRFYSQAYPTLASPQHYTSAELRDLDHYAAEYGITIIPEIDLPAHSSWLTRWDPSIALSCPSMSVTHWPGGSLGGWMIDVTSPKARTVAKTLITELAQTFSGKYIHIGGDEIEYDQQKANCPELVNWSASHGYPYPGDAIVDFTNDLDSTLRSLGKSTELWQWWDFNGQKTSITPNKDIRVDVWLEDPSAKASQGYHTIGSQDGYLYVSAGYGTTPGQYGYMPAENIYMNYPFTTGPNIDGYRISRWSDQAENKPAEWFGFFAQRPLQVLAERTWGGPRSVSAPRYYQRVDSIGGPPAADPLTAIPQSQYQVADVSSQETTAENDAAANAFDDNPLTAWSSQYSPVAPLGPQHLTVDLGASYPVAGVWVEPRQDGKTVSNLYNTQGRIKDYQIQLSNDGRSWQTAASGEFPDDQPGTRITFHTTHARYVRLVAASDWKAVFVDAIAELTVLRAPDSSGVSQ